jgi:hypothetical protein
MDSDRFTRFSFHAGRYRDCGDCLSEHASKEATRIHGLPPNKKQLMIIEKSISQSENLSSEVETELNIKVEYDPKENIVREIISVSVFNHKRLVTTDITAIMVEQFDPALEKMIASIDWREESRCVA